ncbi:hypothetical protein MAR_024620 [Mya arenaria]|uniref:Uncharacterized protein n=1 Tax=Mya arenaria TaxID=6604 RepID=A0ABY7DU99_MYAAR|nr:hypothetical protein MAR_024620 [Mya arenaria]
MWTRAYGGMELVEYPEFWDAGHVMPPNSSEQEQRKRILTLIEVVFALHRSFMLLCKYTCLWLIRTRGN